MVTHSDIGKIVEWAGHPGHTAGRLVTIAPPGNARRAFVEWRGGDGHIQTDWYALRELVAAQEGGGL